MQIASGEPILAIGGFNGSDPTPDPRRSSRQYVAAGKIHYFLASGGGGRGGFGFGRGNASIEEWVADTFKSTTVAGATLYDLTKPT